MEKNNNENMPELMSEEYCSTPHFLGSYEETKATRRALAKRCVEGGREVIFMKYISIDDIHVIGANEEKYAPWESPKGKHLHFEAEVKDPKSGVWEKKVFDLTTAERNASID